MDQETKAVLSKAFNQLKMGETRAAQAILVQMLKADPRLAEAWYLLSFSVLEDEQKIYALRRALQINPNFKDAQERLNGLERSPDQPEEQPTKRDIDTQQRLTRAQTFLDEGNFEAAQRMLRGIIRSNATNQQAWYLLSFASTRHREQVNVLQQALRIDPDFEAARARLGHLQTTITETVQPAVDAVKPAEQLVTGRKVAITPDTVLEPPKLQKTWRETLVRVTKYTLYKGVMLFFTVVVGVYITILIANLGGYIDEIFRGQISQTIMGMVMGGWLEDEPQDQRDAIIEQTTWQMEEEMGLHDPFLLRTFGFLINGLTLNLGDAFLSGFYRGVFRSADQAVQMMVLQRLPYTILLVGVANFLFFFVSIFVALFLSRNYGGILDRISVVLASLLSAPSWIFGIVLIVVLAGELQLLPFPKVIDLRFAEASTEYMRLILSQMILPVMAIFLSVVFTGIFTWRTFFLIYSGEDYVEMARAQGLTNRVIERRYILRPSMPYVITSFAMMMISLWEGAIAIEVLFNWPGVGELFYRAVSNFNPTSVQLIVAVVVVFAYLLAITVFALDIIYAVIDPRVRLTGSKQKLVSVKAKSRFNFKILPKKKSIRQPSSKTWQPSETTADSIPHISLRQRIQNLFKPTSGLRSTWREVAKFPSAIVGLVIILILIGVSIYTLVAIPYDQAVALWQTHNPDEMGRTTWYQNPHNARPLYFNFFRSNKLPETIIRDSRVETIEKSTQPSGEDAVDISYSFVFEYPYGDFPVEMVVFFSSTYEEKAPHISMTWLTPDGREIRLGSLSPERAYRYSIDQDERLARKMRGVPVIEGLLGDPEQDFAVPLNGTYELQISSLVFEPDSNVESEMILYGQVSGLAGTDDQRRDLMVALLWGTPIALAFGFLGAIVTSLLSMLIAAAGVWYGGWLDEAVQRITEVNIILPTLPIAIMVFVMYSKSIWSILWVIVLLNIFGTSIKNYRSVFLQVKEAGYIEGAQAYGASNRRIILVYLLPRIIPVLIPQLVIMVPGFVFYEATLAYLGLSDPQLPTWGKVIHDAVTSGLYQGNYYWVLEPVGLLVLTGLAFALLGFALDRVINPRLRDI